MPRPLPFRQVSRTCPGQLDWGRVPERPISINPGFKFCSVFFKLLFYIPMHCLR